MPPPTHNPIPIPQPAPTAVDDAFIAKFAAAHVRTCATLGKQWTAVAVRASLSGAVASLDRMEALLGTMLDDYEADQHIDQAQLEQCKQLSEGVQAMLAPFDDTAALRLARLKFQKQARNKVHAVRSPRLCASCS